MDTIVITLIAIIVILLVAFYFIMVFAERAYKAEIKLMQSEADFEVYALQIQNGGMRSDLNALSSHRLTEAEQEVIKLKYKPLNLDELCSGK